MTLASATELSTMKAPERIAHFKEYIKEGKNTVKTLHYSGARGEHVCKEMATLFDTLLSRMYDWALHEQKEMEKISIVANGGYGRGQLFPGSDIDLLFLTPSSSGSLSKGVKAGIDLILYGLWDLNLKVGHAVRGISENIAEGKKDAITRTTLLDSRLLAGNAALFTKFQTKYRKDAIENDKANFFRERSADMASRYKKFSETVYLQEPNVKESPGGLRDWHNLQWLADLATEHRELTLLHDDGLISQPASLQLQESVEFLTRLRNEMHFTTGKGTDILSLRLQGEVAEVFQYEGEDILIKIEKLMKDYYTHARNLHNRVEGVFEFLDIELDSFKTKKLTAWLPWRGEKNSSKKKLEGFHERENLLYADHPTTFTEAPSRLLTVFWHGQKHGLNLSPSLRKLIKSHLSLIDADFLTQPDHQNTIEMIFSMRGRVGTTCRTMHRLGLLGEVFPEFGALDCLVQHEFFHRYTADEHTLRCIEMLDRLTEQKESQNPLYGELFQKMEEPKSMYIALLLHDTGRALNTDDHVDGSHLLTEQACKRLNITGECKDLIMFLVDHHLTFFQVGTKKDIDDPEVILDFCRKMKTIDRLEALLVFTYCDSNGTNPDGWSGWKELAITTLYKRALKTMKRSPEEQKAYILEIISNQRQKVKEVMSKKYHDTIQSHFTEMPVAYFRYRKWESIRKHIRAVWQFEARRKRRPDTPFEAAVQWLEQEALGHTELCIVSKDQRNILASICCALATHKINILSAHIHTRTDGIALDLFQVCDHQQKAVTDDIKQMQVVATLYALNKEETYNPTNYIKEHTGYFDSPPAYETQPIVNLSNDEDNTYTSIEVQASDRVGLLHGLLSLFAEYNLITKGARITTERSTAIDSFLIVDQNEQKLSSELLAELKEKITTVATVNI